MKALYYFAVFSLLAFSACKKDEDDNGTYGDDAILVPLSGKISYTERDGTRQIEVFYDSANVPVSLRFYDNFSELINIIVYKYNPAGLPDTVYTLSGDSMSVFTIFTYTYDGLNRLTAYEFEAGSTNQRKYAYNYDMFNKISQFNYYEGNPYVFIYSATVNYPNDSTQVFVYHDAFNTVLATVTTVLDKKINPLHYLYPAFPHNNFKQNIKRQFSAQADSIGMVLVNGVAIFLQSNTSYQYFGNYPTHSTRQSWDNSSNSVFDYYYQ
jgi:hypothetical protein